MAKIPSKKAPRKTYEKSDAGKAARFVDFANARVPRAIKAMRAVGKLTGNNYRYTPEQAQKILGALADEFNRVKSAFEGKAAPDDTFTL